jgi:hypothetical protein
MPPMDATAGEVASFWRGPGSNPVWVAPVLGAVVFLYCGRPFLEGGLTELRSRHQPLVDARDRTAGRRR